MELFGAQVSLEMPARAFRQADFRQADLPRMEGAIVFEALDRAAQRRLMEITAPAVVLGRDRPRRLQRIDRHDTIGAFEDEAEQQCRRARQRSAGNGFPTHPLR